MRVGLLCQRWAGLLTFHNNRIIAKYMAVQQNTIFSSCCVPNSFKFMCWNLTTIVIVLRAGVLRDKCVSRVQLSWVKLGYYKKSLRQWAHLSGRWSYKALDILVLTSQGISNLWHQNFGKRWISIVYILSNAT